MSMQSNYIKQQMRAIVGQMSSMDVSKLPSLVTMVRLREVLIAKGMTVAMAEAVVSSMKIEVGEGFTEDQAFMEEIIEGYATTLLAILVELNAHFASPELAMKMMASGMSITYQA